MFQSICDISANRADASLGWFLELIALQDIFEALDNRPVNGMDGVEAANDNSSWYIVMMRRCHVDIL